MSISGGIKFFEQSKSLIKKGASGYATSGSSAVVHMLNPNTETFWQSASSNDLTLETINITLSELSTIDRLFLIGINWKEFAVQYKLAGVWTDFTNVISLDNAIPGTEVSELAWSLDTAYFEFDSVETQEIQITVLKTQVADEEKYCNQFIASFELGTFVGYPIIDNVDTDRGTRVKKTLTSKYIIQNSLEALSYKIKFETYPTADEIYHADIDLVMDIQDMDESFLVWLCGGKYGSENFNYTLKGFRLKDVKQMKVKSKIPLKYMNNTYVNPIDLKFDLLESIL